MNRRDGAQSNRTATKLFDNRQEELSIHFIEAVDVDFHSIQRIAGDILRDLSVVVDFSMSRTRRSSRLTMRGVLEIFWRFPRAMFFDFNAENLSRAFRR